MPVESLSVEVGGASEPQVRASQKEQGSCKAICLVFGVVLLVLAIVGLSSRAALERNGLLPWSFTYLPVRSPGGAPAAPTPHAKGTLMVVTMFLSRDFELRDRYAKRVVGSVLDTFSSRLQHEFRRRREDDQGEDDPVGGISKILIVNECIPPDTEPGLRQKVEARLRAMEAQFGGEWNFETLQKTDDCGQAGSLNIVLDSLSTYEYWLHWEESWFVDPEFRARYDTSAYWDAVYATMSEHQAVGQLQFHKRGPEGCDGFAGEGCLSTEPVSKYLKTRLPRLNGNMARFWHKVRPFSKPGGWLPFSLRPALNRASMALNAGYFDPDPLKRAVLFEQEYGMKWCYGTGGAWPPPQGYDDEKAFKATFGPHDLAFAIRNEEDHKHTYRRLIATAAQAAAPAPQEFVA